jgi:hypothetical protein
LDSSFSEQKAAVYAAIERRYACDHPKREIRRRIIANGRVAFVAQCVACGHTSYPIAKKMALAQSPSPPPYDEHMQDRRRAAKRAEYERAFLDLQPALAAEYRAYLLTPGWRDRRREALRRAAGLCEICPSPASEVHHLTYSNLGHERPEELVALCSACHRFVHERPDGTGSRTADRTDSHPWNVV